MNNWGKNTHDCLGTKVTDGGVVVALQCVLITNFQISIPSMLPVGMQQKSSSFITLGGHKCRSEGSQRLLPAWTVVRSAVTPPLPQSLSAVLTLSRWWSQLTFTAPPAATRTMVRVWGFPFLLILTHSCITSSLPVYALIEDFKFQH